MAADALCLDPLRRLTGGAAEKQHRRQPELARKLVDDFDRGVAVVVEEASMHAHEATLQGEAAAMVGATTLDGYREVRRRQAPVLRELILAGVDRNRQPPPGYGRRCLGVTRRG